jgi:YidC/Oxa1 family membrane protein insertase
MQTISLVYQTVFYKPLFNLLLFFAFILPGGNLGVAIILVTIVVRIILFPLTHKTTVMQRKMKEIEPKIKQIQSEHKSDREKQGQLLMAVYKEHGVNPLTSIFLLFLQIPIFIALFHAFTTDISAASPYLYSFTPFPDHINTTFLGFIDLKHPSVFLALCAAISQFVQLKLSFPPKSPATQKTASAPNPQQSMMYILPLMIFLFSSPLPFGWHIFPTLPAAAALYWTMNNLFAIVHEALVRRKAQRMIAA